MSVIGLHGIPGSGKTLICAVLARKHYRRQNGRLRRFLRCRRGEEEFLNNVYSNFPIVLDKKRNIYSNIVSIDDCNNKYSFLPGAVIFIDEVQAFFDSYRDFKKFPKEIASFFQFHRHFGIQDIYLVSQHPRRMVTYIRDVITQFNRMRRFIKIPLTPFGIITYRTIYEFDDYKYAFSRNDETKEMYDIRGGFVFFNYKKAFKSFLSVYLYELNYDKPLINKGNYSNISLPSSQVEYLNKRLFNAEASGTTGARRVMNDNEIIDLI